MPYSQGSTGEPVKVVLTTVCDAWPAVTFPASAEHMGNTCHDIIMYNERVSEQSLTITNF